MSIDLLNNCHFDLTKITNCYIGSELFLGGGNISYPIAYNVVSGTNNSVIAFEDLDQYSITIGGQQIILREFLNTDGNIIFNENFVVNNFGKNYVKTLTINVTGINKQNVDDLKLFTLTSEGQLNPIPTIAILIDENDELLIVGYDNPLTIDTLNSTINGQSNEMILVYSSISKSRSRSLGEGSPIPTPGPSNTPLPSLSVTPTPSISRTPSVTPSVTPSISVSITPTPTISTSVTPSVTPSISVSITPTVTPTISLSVTPSISVSVTPSISISVTPTPSESIAVTPSITPTLTPTPSCARPEGTVAFTFWYAFNDPFFNWQSSLTDACYAQSVWGTRSPLGQGVEALALEIGNKVYNGSGTSCAPMSSPFYYIIVSGGTPYIIHLATGGIIDDFPVMCPTPTPSVTPSITVTPSISVSVTPSISISPTPTISITPSITVSPSPSPVVQFADWYLASSGETFYIHQNLFLNAIGPYTLNAGYWTSTELGSPNSLTYATMATFYSPVIDLSGNQKDSTTAQFLPVRNFNTTTGSYSIGDVGPAGGHIFFIEDLGGGNSKYYEAYGSSTPTKKWSTTLSITGAQGTAVGDGQSNTTTILATTGTDDNAAYWCDNLVVI